MRKEITTTLSANCSMFSNILVMDQAGGSSQKKKTTLNAYVSVDNFNFGQNKVSLFLC